MSPVSEPVPSLSTDESISPDSFSLLRPALRLAEHSALGDNDEPIIEPQALAAAEADIGSRLREAAIPEHLFEYSQIFDPGSGHLQVHGVSTSETTERWLTSPDVENSNDSILQSRAKAEHREAKVLDSVAREIYKSGELPGIKILTISAYPEESETANIGDVSSGERKPVQIRLFSFTREETPEDIEVKVHGEQAMLAESNLEACVKLARKSGAIVPESATSDQILHTLIPIAEGRAESVSEIAEQYYSILGKIDNSFERESHTPLSANREDTEAKTQPFVDQDLDFNIEIAHSLKKGVATDAVEKFAQLLLNNAELAPSNRRLLMKSLSHDEVFMDQSLAKFLVEQHFMYVATQLSCMLETPQAISALGESETKAVADLASSNLERPLAMTDQIKLICKAAPGKMSFSSCGEGIGTENDSKSMESDHIPEDPTDVGPDNYIDSSTNLSPDPTYLNPERPVVTVAAPDSSIGLTVTASIEANFCLVHHKQIGGVCSDCQQTRLTPAYSSSSSRRAASHTASSARVNVKTETNFVSELMSKIVPREAQESKADNLAEVINLFDSPAYPPEAEVQEVGAEVISLTFASDDGSYMGSTLQAGEAAVIAFPSSADSGSAPVAMAA